MTSLSFRAKNSPRPFYNGRFLFIRTLVIFLFSLLLVRLVYVQAVLRTDLLQKADRQVPEKKLTKNERGQILDRDGVVLAETVQIVSCYVDPKQVGNKLSTSRILGDLLNLNAESLHREMKKTRNSFLWVKRNISFSELESIKSRKLKGVAFKKEWRRNYPLSPIAPNLLGMVGMDGHGLSGIEMQYESTLSGTSPGSASSPKSVSAAGHVELCLDSNIQRIVERELEWGAQKTKAKKGMAIVQNPTSGEILAIASWPPISLDPDHPSQPNELRIPGIVDSFEPGSTFKIVTAAAAIEEKMIRPKEIFSGEQGKWKVMDITIHDHEPRGWMDFDDVFIYSSNIGTAKIAERIGTEKMFQYARLFGFGVYPGSGLPAEAKGMLRPPKKWSGVSKYVVSFGQEVSVTALQLVGAYSVIANGGMLMEPRLVKSIRDEDNHVIWHSKPNVVRRVVSLRTIQHISDILSKVVEEGTGQYAAVQWRKDLKVAGKTGTAQKFDIVTGRYHQNINLVSFCGFFPVGAPKYTMVVILDEPEGRRWGGMDAAPVFRRIAEQLMPLVNT